MRFRSILLWLFVINLGIAFGAGIYEARVVIPGWKELPPSTWPNTGIQFWVYVTTIPLTLLVLGNAVAAWMEKGPRRFWWRVAVAIAIMERIATFGYFIPTMVGLAGSEGLSQVEVNAGLEQWLMFNHGRHVLTFSAWMAAMQALLLGEQKLENV